MANGKPPTMPIAYNDFFKTNGSDTVFYTDGPSLTRQEFLEECDINHLMKQYDAHVIGGPGNLAPMEPMYFDFADMPQDLLSYHEFMNGADAAFMSLPAVVRKEFENNALEFVAFASDPANLDQMRAWGLAPPAPVAVPSAAPAAPAAPPSGSLPSGGAPAPASSGPSTHGST